MRLTNKFLADKRSYHTVIYNIMINTFNPLLTL